MNEEEYKKIRETVLQALSKTTQSASQEILSLIHELEQLFSLAKIGNCISHMNASILIEELQKVQKMIQNQHAFPADFFADDIEVKETPQTQIQPVETKQETDFKGHSVAERPVGAMSFKKQSVVSVTQNQRQNGRKSKRRDMIIDALRKKGKTSIKDIARLVRGCSEKTIQRELGDLIDEGLVLKEGERRWSRYRLV